MNDIDLSNRLSAGIIRAYAHGPAVRALLDHEGIDPAGVNSLEALSAIPVTTKEELLERQRRDPPFGGMLASDLREVPRVYVSPGPIYEPVGGLGADGGYADAFRRAGIGRDDIVLNMWSYHLVRAGLMLDAAFASTGSTVVAGGIGNSEVQAQIMMDLGVTVVAASTPFFEVVIGRLGELGYELPRDWNLRIAVLGAEPGAWHEKRRDLEARLEIETLSTYGTADVGLVGRECPHRDGYHVRDDLIVQVCDPGTGEPLAPDETGEVVITSLDRHYPLIRFGTGDAAHLVGERCACGDPDVKLSSIEGRTSQATKVRQLFVYPRHAADIAGRVPDVAGVRLLVRRRDGIDELDLSVQLEPGVELPTVERALRDAVADVTRLRAGLVELRSPEPDESAHSIEDLRELS